MLIVEPFLRLFFKSSDDIGDDVRRMLNYLKQEMRYLHENGFKVATMADMMKKLTPYM
jgi:hypothetical protein